MIDPQIETPHNRLPPDDRSTDESDESKSHGSAAELFAPLMLHFQELLEYVSYYLSAQSDLVRAKVRRLALYTVLGIIGAIAVATTLVVAVVLVLVGIAGGLGELFANRPWAGSLATGCILLAVAFGSLKLVLPQWVAQSRRKVKEKYDRRRQTQRARFGHDVDEVRKN